MIDFHCHIDLYPDPACIAATADKAGIYVLSVTTTPKAWPRTAALANGKRRIRTALGLHPELAKERQGELSIFDRLLPETRYVGEVGLDGSPEQWWQIQAQRKVFEHVLDACSGAGGRVLSIHSRRASREVLDLLARYPGAGTPILHWFSGPKRDLDQAIDQGCWFSVGLPMTRSRRGAELIARMPRDRILTETDGPFAADKGRPLSPVDAVGATEGVARVWEVPRADAERQLTANLRSLGECIVRPATA